MTRVVCQFSCGAASAVATKLALAQHAGLHEVHILNAFLLEVLLELRGMVIVSGYDSELYSGMLGDWRREETDSRIAAGRGTKVRREVAWINPACADALERVPGGLWA